MPGLLALLGRERELAELEATWEAVAAGSGAAAVIRGEAGIGKTRLAERVALPGTRLRRPDRRVRGARPGGCSAAQPVGRADSRAAAGDRGAARRGGLAGRSGRPDVRAARALRAQRRAERRDAARTAAYPAVRGGGGTVGPRRAAGAGAARARGRTHRRRAEPRVGRLRRPSRRGAPGDGVDHTAGRPIERRRRPSRARPARARTCWHASSSSGRWRRRRWRHWLGRRPASARQTSPGWWTARKATRFSRWRLRERSAEGGRTSRRACEDRSGPRLVLCRSTAVVWSRSPRSPRVRSRRSSSAGCLWTIPRTRRRSAPLRADGGRRRRRRLPARAAARSGVRGDRRAAPAWFASPLGAGAARLRAGRRDPAARRAGSPVAAGRRRRRGGATAGAGRGERQKRRRARGGGGLSRGGAGDRSRPRGAVGRARRARSLAPAARSIGGRVRARVRPPGRWRAAGSRALMASACPRQPRPDLLPPCRPRQRPHCTRADRADPASGER